MADTASRRGSSMAHLSRRRFLELGAAATAVSLGAGPLARRAAAQAPRPGGIVKQAWLSSPRTLDPALAIQGDEYMIMQNLFDNLVRIDEKLQPQPQLATRWAADDQGKTWTFYLRPGVKFHHGKPLTAQDVVFTVERILDPKTASPGRSVLGTIEKVEAVDAGTVRFRLGAPYADLPLNLGATFGRILPSDRADKIATEPSGTGPFRLAEYRPGDRTRMVKNPDYWDTGKPYLDELWQVNLPQAAAQIASLAGGDVQMIFEVAVPFIPSLQRNAGVSVVEVKSPSFQPVTMASNQKPFDDNRVRLAMKHAVDREGIIKAVWQGHGVVGEDHPVPTVNPYYAPTTPKHAYDPTKAKQLLAEAGYPNGINVELWTSNERVGLQELAVAVQQMAAPAGITLEVKTVPWSVFNSTVYKKKSLYVNNWFGRGTIDETLYAYFRTGGGWNEGDFSKPELDRILDEGRSTVDMEKRKKIYAQAQQFIHDEGHMVVPYHMNYVTAMRSNVKGYVVHPLRYCDFRWTYLEG
jgi:peptide/nickel transport system substrate-binding protein